MIIQQVHLNGFIDAFTCHGRANQYSLSGFSILHDWLEQISDDTDKPYILDVVGISCDWSEMTHKEALEHTSLSDIDEVHDKFFCLSVGDDRILISQ